MKQTKYDFELKSTTERGKDVYTFRTDDGVPSKEGFRESELLIADTVEPSIDEDILVVQGGWGFLGVILGDQAPGGRTVVGETSDRARQLSSLNIKENSVDNAEAVRVPFYSRIDEGFDTLVYAPHSYEPVDVVKNRIAELAVLMDEGDNLYIAGGKNDGINRYSSYMHQFPGESEKVAQDSGKRLYCWTKEENFQPQRFDTGTEFTAEVEGVKAEFKAEKGLFSPDRLDDASRLLLETLEFEGEEKVLDLACGYGAIGIFLSKMYGVDVSFTDDSAVATQFTEENIELNGIEECRVENADCLDGFSGEEFDAIVSNPPTHQGSSVTEEIFLQSHESLKVGGSLYIVYNRNMKFEKDLEEIFRRVEVVAEQDNFRMTRAIR
jgi:16S rRNA (guanine1207-N2)-methyltransferase